MQSINNEIHTLNQAVKQKCEDVRLMTIQIENLRIKLLNLQNLEIQITHLPDDILQNIKSFLNLTLFKLPNLLQRYNKLQMCIVPKRDKMLENILQDVIANPANFEIDTIKITEKIVAIKWTDDIKTKHFKKDNLEGLKLKLTRDSLVYGEFRNKINKMMNRLKRQYLRICYNYSLTETYIPLQFDGISYTANPIYRTNYNKNHKIGCNNIEFDRF